MIDELNTVEEIEARIADLRKHQQMFSTAGRSGYPAGYKMTMQVISDIHDLEIKRDDLINGTNNYEILKKEREIKNLKDLKEKAIIFQKRKYNKQINKAEKELENLKSK